MISISLSTITIATARLNSTLAGFGFHDNSLDIKPFPAINPPSTLRTTPVIHSASAEARKSAAFANILRGKNKTNFTPHADCGDNVIIINADKVRFTGNKLNDKEYKFYSGYPGGLRTETAKQLLVRRPTYVVEHAIKGMLPKNKLGAEIFRNLHVYQGSEHPHIAQQPKTLSFDILKTSK